METIAEITGSHSGTGKNGKPYTITKVKTASGKYASTFDVVEIGDQIELSNYNEQYKNWQAKKPELKTTAPIAQNEIIERLDRIEKRIIKITELLEAKDEPREPEEPYVQAEGDIPF